MNYRNFRLLMSTWLRYLVVGAIAISGPAIAQEIGSLAEVTVTAQKSEQNLQDVPIAITVIDQSELRRRGLTTVADALEATPTITMAPYVNSSNTFFMYMRGIGFIDPGQIGTDGAIGLYQDGFYISRPQGISFDLGDTQRIEVLRGPQGTLYGRNTIGGAVNLISAAPTGTAGFRQELDGGNQHYLRALSIMDLSSWKAISTKISLVGRSTNGEVENPASTKGFGADSQKGAKVQLLWAADSRFKADYFGDYTSDDSTPNYGVNTAFAGVPFVPGIPYVAPFDRPDSAYRAIALPTSGTRSSMHGITTTWIANADVTLRSLTGYRWLNAKAFQNFNEMFGLRDFANRNAIRDHQLSEEVQALGRIPSCNVEFVAGVYHFEEDTSNHLDGSAYGLGEYDMSDETERSQSDAVYGQATWSATTRLKLTLGGRYTRDWKRGMRTRQNLLSNQAEIGALAEVKDSRFTPAFTAMYQLSDNASTYIRAASGYKSGAPNANAPIGGFSQTYGPESLVSYEAGLKSLWFNGRSRVNVAVFDTKYKDQQRAFQVSPTVFDYEPFNIGRVTLQGAELELVSNLARDLSVSLNYAYLNGRIDELTAPAHTILDPAVNPYSPYHVGEDIRGLFNASQGYAPRHSVDGAVDYELARSDLGGVSAHLDYRWQAKRDEVGPDVPGSQFAQAPAYGLLSGRIAWSWNTSGGRRTSLTLWGRNLLDNKAPVWVNGFGASVPVSATPAGFTGSLVVGWVAPRQYGISIAYQM